MSQRALFVLTSHDSLGDTKAHTGYHLAEVSHVWSVLREAGLEVTLASVAGGKPPMDPSSHDLEDPINREFLNTLEVQSALELTPNIATLKADHYDVLYFPGGHGTMWDLPHNKEVERLIRGVYRNGGVVAAVCHGPAAFVGVKRDDGSFFIKGHRVAAFTNEEERAAEKADIVPFLLHDKLKAQGATLKSGGNFEAQVVTDGRIVTGQNPASATPLAKAILAQLKEAPRKAS